MNTSLAEASSYLNLGIAQCHRSEPQAAIDSFDRALQLEPGLTAAWTNLGLALVVVRRLSEALDAFNQALRLEPRSPTALYNRGNVLLELGRAEDALDSYRRLLRDDPNDADALTNCGIVLLQLERPAEALDALDAALRNRPTGALTLLQRGIALSSLGRHHEALQNYDRAPLRDINHPEIRYRRGYTYALLLRLEPALHECKRALEQDPEHGGALFLAGMAAAQLNRTGEAVHHFDRLLAKDADYPYARGARFNSRARECDWREFDAERRIIIASAMRGTTVDSPFPFLSVSGSPRAQLECAKAFVRDKYPPRPSPPNSPVHRDHSRIRVAYVSGDLRNHAVSRLMVGVFERHDRKCFEIFAVSTHPQEDGPFARRVVASFDRFLDVSARADADICALLRDLEIDIAVDLTGFTEGARTAIFVNRQAPVQVNYLGFPGTLGAPFMDYLIADRFVVPPESAADYAEKIVYLPECFQANDDRRELPAATDRVQLGLPARGFVWCCMNAGAKLNPEMFAVWMRLLRDTPGSVLWLLAGSEAMMANLRREAAARNVDADRIVFAPRVSYEKHVARLRAADLYLDTSPFSAGATASDVLWAGLPLLTCSGEAFAARMAGSMLKSLGLTELIADDLAAYEGRALALARAPERLARMRDDIDAMRYGTPLFDTARFCRHLECAYTHMIERARRGEPAESFAVEPAAETDK